MIVTGHKILDALDYLKERAKTVEGQFTASLHRFEGDESKRDPREIVDEYDKIQRHVARLMEVQANYNVLVEIQVQGESMSLQRVLQLISSANRIKNLWSSVSVSQPTMYHYGNPLARDKEHEYAKPVVSLAEAEELSSKASLRAMALKQAIRSGNAREVELEVEPELFDLDL